MSYYNQIRVLVWKDLASEFRSKEMLNSMLIFALLTTVIFSFAFDPEADTVKKVFPGVIWVALCFAGILGLNRSFQGEKSNDCFMGLLLCTPDPGVVYLGKLFSNLIFMLIIELISLPILFLLFDYRLQGSLGWLVLVIALGTWGFIAIGTFLSALAMNTKNSELLLPVILFPLLIPLLIAAVKATGLILGGGDFASWSNWLGIICSFDLIFTVVSWFLFDYVLEV
ncbi:MAG: heme exporter protein CcmB [Clostridia bacterium]|nr:heme exporter protein CcmB [Clostridia bacterium]